MSNKTVKDAQLVHGKDPQLLVEKIIRERIYESLYWKEECFGLNAETLLDKAVELSFVGGTYANQRPIPFLCLLLKLLQIQPSLPIITEYIIQEDFKYLRVLGLLYYRLVAPAAKVYRMLEPYLCDRRKLRIRSQNGAFGLTFVDEVVDKLLTQDRVFDIILPRLTKRNVLEDAEELEEREDFIALVPSVGFSEAVDREQEALIAASPQQQDMEESTEFKEALSIEETNELRAKLGLKPLSAA